MTFRPPLVLRILGWTMTVCALILLLAGVLELTGAMDRGRMDAGDAGLMTASAAVLLAVGVLIVLKSSVAVRLDRASLSYRKLLVVAGSMRYDDIAAVTIAVGPAQGVTVRDVHGHRFAINLFSVDWRPLVAWAADHDRADILEVLG